MRTILNSLKNLSLATKLLVAFTAASLIAIVLVAIAMQYYIGLHFDDYVLSQHRSQFQADVLNFYSQSGDWNTVRQNLGGAPALEDDLPPTGANNLPPQGANGNRPNAAARPQQNTTVQTAPARFVVVDLDGIVQIPFGDYRIGNAVSVDIIAGGEPIFMDDVQIGTIITTSDSLQRDPDETQYLDQTNQALIVAAFGAVMAALILSYLLARIVTRPLKELTIGVQRVADGDFEQQVPVRSQDELGTLASAFNQMSQDLAHQHYLRRQMTADIAHDLRSPLTVLSGYLESMRDGVLKPSSERFEMLYQEAQGLQHLVEDLRLLSLADAGELSLNRSHIAPQDILQQTVEAFGEQARQQNVKLKVNQIDVHTPIELDPDRFGRVLRNLVSNALRYTPSGGEIALSAEKDAHNVHFIVQDTGIGIPPEKLSNIFERFYRVESDRTDEAGESGLGLSIVKSIVDAHGGTIEVASEINKGTIFTIALPLVFSGA